MSFTSISVFYDTSVQAVVTLMSRLQTLFPEEIAVIRRFLGLLSGLRAFISQEMVAWFLYRAFRMVTLIATCLCIFAAVKAAIIFLCRNVLLEAFGFAKRALDPASGLLHWALRLAVLPSELSQQSLKDYITTAFRVSEATLVPVPEITLESVSLDSNGAYSVASLYGKALKVRIAATAMSPLTLFSAQSTNGAESSIAGAIRPISTKESPFTAFFTAAGSQIGGGVRHGDTLITAFHVIETALMYTDMKYPVHLCHGTKQYLVPREVLEASRRCVESLDLTILKLNPAVFTHLGVRAAHLAYATTDLCALKLRDPGTGEWSLRMTRIERGDELFEIRHFASTQPGHSGFPIWNNDKIVGIHTRTSNGSNFGVVLDILLVTSSTESPAPRTRAWELHEEPDAPVFDEKIDENAVIEEREWMYGEIGGKQAKVAWKAGSHRAIYTLVKPVEKYIPKGRDWNDDESEGGESIRPAVTRRSLESLSPDQNPEVKAAMFEMLAPKVPALRTIEIKPAAKAPAPLVARETPPTPSPNEPASASKTEKPEKPSPSPVTAAAKLDRLQTQMDQLMAQIASVKESLLPPLAPSPPDFGQRKNEASPAPPKPSTPSDESNSPKAKKKTKPKKKAKAHSEKSESPQPSGSSPPQ